MLVGGAHLKHLNDARKADALKQWGEHPIRHPPAAVVEWRPVTSGPSRNFVRGADAQQPTTTAKQSNAMARYSRSAFCQSSPVFFCARFFNPFF
jgi:hypothetical protein